MKNVKKNTIFFGAVIVALLMISSATAVNLPQTDESNELEAEKIVDELVNYVDPNIYLSGQEELNILLEALDLLNFDDDPDVYLLLQEIIAVMNSKGYADSSDIEQIIHDNDLEVGTITFGGISTGGPAHKTFSGGVVALCPRRPFCLGLIVCSSILFFRTCTSNMPGNQQILPPQITISGKFINYDIRGITIGFIGLAGNQGNYNFNMIGFALVIVYQTVGSSEQTQIEDQQSKTSTPTQEQNQLENNQPTSTPSNQQTTVFQQIRQLVQNIIINIKLRYQTTSI